MSNIIIEYEEVKARMDGMIAVTPFEILRQFVKEAGNDDAVLIEALRDYIDKKKQ